MYLVGENLTIEGKEFLKLLDKIFPRILLLIIELG